MAFALIRGAASHYVAGKPAFDLVLDLVLSTRKESSSRLEIIGGLITILEEFAMVPSRVLAARGSRRQPNAQQSASLQRVPSCALFCALPNSHCTDKAPWTGQFRPLTRCILSRTPYQPGLRNHQQAPKRVSAPHAVQQYVPDHCCPPLKRGERVGLHCSWHLGGNHPL